MTRLRWWVITEPGGLFAGALRAVAMKSVSAVRSTAAIGAAAVEASGEAATRRRKEPTHRGHVHT
jgi:hypothetical protein